MVRLIDADELKSVFTEKSTKAVCGAELCKAIISIIDDAPTVDAVPVIRCCDCIYFEYLENQFVQMTHCDVHDRCPDYTDYCSWAVRKER